MLPDGFREYSLEFNVRSQIDSTRQISSFSTVDKNYILNLGSQTCTCPDFKERFRLFDENHFGRLCKHLIWALSENDAFILSDKWQAAIVETGRGGPYFAAEIGLTRGPSVLMTAGQSNEWINIFAHTRRRGEATINASGPIHQYGWSVVAHRWSYGKGPNGAGELRKLLVPYEGFSIQPNIEARCDAVKSAQVEHRPSLSEYQDQHSRFLEGPSRKSGFFRRIFKL